MSKINIVLDAEHSAVLLSKLQKQTEYSGNCWLFTGAKAVRGYRQLQFRNKRILTHRLSAAIFLGLDLNSNLQANHKLICPNKACWNPDHLYVGTQADNMMNVGTQIRESDRYCKQGHLITGLIYTKGKTRKICDICKKARSKRWYDKVKENKQ